MSDRTQLSSKQQSIVEEHLERDARTPRKNASASVWELITRKTLAADELLKDPLWKKHRRFASLPDDQLQVICLTGKRSGDGLFPPDCIGDGILRRFALNSPLELALRLSIGARYQWASGQWNGNCNHDELWRPILQAIAARDFTAAKHLADMAKLDHQPPAPILTGVTSLLRKDHHLLQSATVPSTKKDPAYIKAIKSVLKAVADGSAADFANAMNEMLSAYRRYMFGDELYGLVDPHALGLYELCRRFDPLVVAEFDLGRKLPWDQEYHGWSQQIADISDHFNVTDVPETIGRFLFRFETIPWGKQVLANWHSA